MSMESIHWAASLPVATKRWVYVSAVALGFLALSYDLMPRLAGENVQRLFENEIKDVIRYAVLALGVIYAGIGYGLIRSKSRYLCAQDTTAANVPRDQGTLDKREYGRLIASDKVEGTVVYNHKGDRLGTIRHIMVDKLSGKVAYAVMISGDFLGIGDSYRALRWSALDYDTNMGGFVVDLDKSQPEDAPSAPLDAGLTPGSRTRRPPESPYR